MIKEQTRLWKVDKWNEVPIIFDGNGREVAQLALNRLADDDAAHIVKCVNLHEELVQALQHIVLDFEHFKDFPSDADVMTTMYERAKQALARAKEPQP
jgi:capsid portal protein